MYVDSHMHIHTFTHSHAHAHTHMRVRCSLPEPGYVGLPGRGEINQKEYGKDDSIHNWLLAIGPHLRQTLGGLGNDPTC